MKELGYKEKDFVGKFFEKKKFKYQMLEKGADGKQIVDGSNSHNKMSYCATCKILRPPRSFHCGTCGVCIEIHDHHCPWVGTCIGPRNARLFVAFLFLTSLHALVTFLVCVIVMMYCDSFNDDSI